MSVKNMEEQPASLQSVNEVLAARKKLNQPAEEETAIVCRG